MEKQIFQIPATISKISTMHDRSLRLVIDTQELSDTDSAKVFSLYNKLGGCLFSPQEINKEDLIDLPEIKVEKGQKTDSQRLRNIIYILWKQQGKKENSEDFYHREMTKLIEGYKSKLN